MTKRDWREISDWVEDLINEEIDNCLWYIL